MAQFSVKIISLNGAVLDENQQPPHLLPDAVAAFSVWTPTRAMAELAWAALDGRAIPLRYLGVLTFWTALAAGISATALARQNRAQFG